jgi:hypothetical protein
MSNNKCVVCGCGDKKYTLVEHIKDGGEKFYQHFSNSACHDAMKFELQNLRQENELMHQHGQEFIWGEDNPHEYQGLVTKYEKALSRINALALSIKSEHENFEEAIKISGEALTKKTDYKTVMGLRCSVHMHLNVRQFITRPLNKYPKGLFTKDDGSVMTNREAREALLDELQQGHVVIPCGKCDNFDYSGEGCLGHPIEEKSE